MPVPSRGSLSSWLGQCRRRRPLQLASPAALLLLVLLLALLQLRPAGAEGDAALDAATTTSNDDSQPGDAFHAARSAALSGGAFGDRSRFRVIVGARDTAAPPHDPRELSPLQPLAAAALRPPPVSPPSLPPASSPTASTAATSVTSPGGSGSGSSTVDDERSGADSSGGAISESSNSAGSEEGTSSSAATTTEDPTPLTVTHPLMGTGLRLGDQRFMVKGLDVGPAAAVAARGADGRQQVEALLDEAQSLGLNAIRAWAFDSAAGGLSASSGNTGHPAKAWQAWRQQRQQTPPPAAPAPGIIGEIVGGELLLPPPAQTAAGWTNASAAAQAAVAAGSGKREGENATSAAVVFQPAPGVVDETALRGLDWLVAAAATRGLRTMLVLIDGGGAGVGGAVEGDGPFDARRYCEWVDLGEGQTSVASFYGNDTVKSVFLDYVASLLARKNSITGAEYRFDASVLGWQLAAGPVDPGFPGSERLQTWIRQMAAFIRQRSPRQLISTGTDGTFGPSSPHHRHRNPLLPAAAALLSSVASLLPGRFNAACSGSDFFLHNYPWEIDAATLRLDPSAAVACDDECLLTWARNSFTAHLQDAVRLQKPLLVGGVGASAPPPLRARLVDQLQRQVAAAAERGHPVGGWFLDAPAMLDSAAPARSVSSDRPLAGDARFWQQAEMRRCVLYGRSTAAETEEDSVKTTKEPAAADGDVGGPRHKKGASPGGWTGPELAAIGAAAAGKQRAVPTVAAENEQVGTAV